MAATWNHKRTKLEHCTIVLIGLYHIFSYVQVHGLSISSHKTVELAKRKGVIKTTQNEDGDVIDCVDIYKQPAFDHPLLKNHTIQMKPSYYPRGIKVEKIEAADELFQGNMECPEGTVPILRTQINNSSGANFPQRKKYPPQVAGPGHEYVQVSAVDGNYFGGIARLNLWNPATFNDDFSLAQIWVMAGARDELNTVEAGWITRSGQKDTRLFVYWTSDGYKKTGCYNFDCPGFVQVSKKIYVNARLRPLSTYQGKQYECLIIIFKDKSTGNWWLRFQDINIGYWPSSILTKLLDRADVISWGGEVLNTGRGSGGGRRHTSTQMGSGHFPNEKYGKAAYFRNLAYADEPGDIVDARKVVPFVTRPECYDVLLPGFGDWGTHFYYGGPGFSDKCK